MKSLIICVLCALGAYGQNSSSIQDSKVDVGGYRLQFHVVQGKSPTIVFESGGGDDSSVWSNLIPAIAGSDHFRRCDD